MADKELTKFAKQLMSILPDIHRELSRAPKNEFSLGEISLPQMTILGYLSQKKTCAMGDIAKLLSVSMSAATGLSDRMIKNKLVKRHRGVKDRRIVWITITARGKRVDKSIKRFKYNLIKRLFKKISKDERRKYLDIIGKVRDGITNNRMKK